MNSTEYVGCKPVADQQQTKNTFISHTYSFLSNTSYVLNKSYMGPQGEKLIKITHLISITVNQFSLFN